MQVVFKCCSADDAPRRDAAVRRVRFSLRRLSWLVPRATVRLSDVNGPRGGVDKRCQVQLETDGDGPVVVTALARDWRSALDGALATASRVLLKSWQRKKDRRPPRSTGRGSPAALLVEGSGS